MHIFATDDHITLEHNDTVQLIFNPIHNLLLPSLEAVGEFVRHNTSVRIMDNDSRSSKV